MISSSNLAWLHYLLERPCVISLYGETMAKPGSLPEIANNPDNLSQLSLSEFRALWAQCCPKTRSPPHRCLLERDLDFVAQGGGTKLLRETDVLVRAAMKQTSVPDPHRKRCCCEETIPNAIFACNR